MNLPVEKILPDLKDSLKNGNSVILKAPPGAGKTTIVPISLLDEKWLDGKKIIILEPRRLAARSAACRMADNLGESVGKTVGYRTRADSRISHDTKIEVVTEGIFTRHILNNPELKNISLVIFDEFHERSIHTDIGLALALDVQSVLRDDLKILIMSATLDPKKISVLFDKVKTVECEGRMFDVKTEYFPKLPHDRLEVSFTKAIGKALSEEKGSILGFLPGTGEIRRVQEKLLSDFNLPDKIMICPLYGDLEKREQDAAIQPAPPGKRKIVLATSIAESSITIDGISVVIDCGLSRKSVFDPRTGMSHLETVKISRASAEQRKGRAGRTHPGKCYRLWAQNENSSLPEYDVPEIIESDLASPALALSKWGVSDPETLKWLDVPPPAKFAQAVRLLTELDALDAKGKITAHGKKILETGTHPRLANMILGGVDLGFGSLACDIAAIIEERDLIKFKAEIRNSDLRLRISALRNDAVNLHIDSSLRNRVKSLSDEFRRRLDVKFKNDVANFAGVLLGFAYPDRIAKKRKEQESVYLLSNGRAAKFANIEALSKEEFLTIAELDDKEKDAKILLAAPLTRNDLDKYFGNKIRIAETVEWNEREGAINAVGRRVFGEIILEEYPLKNPEENKIKLAVLDKIRKEGLSFLNWPDEAENLRRRIELAAGIDKENNWPDLSEQSLVENLESWLSPFLSGIRKTEDFKRINLKEALHNLLDFKQKKLLEKLAPAYLKVPSGSMIRLDYREKGAPILAARVQELFGAKEHPRVGGGKIPVLIKILSPSMRPVQTTSDLPSFWKTSYQLVKKDLKGRYPKHYWPDNPMEVSATKGLKPKK